MKKIAIQFAAVGLVLCLMLLFVVVLAIDWLHDLWGWWGWSLIAIIGVSSSLKKYKKPIVIEKETAPPHVHKRVEVMAEVYHQSRTNKRLSAAPKFDRTREIIVESLELAMSAKRRATAESRLDVAESMLNELRQLGDITSWDVEARQAVRGIREKIEGKFRKRTNVPKLFNDRLNQLKVGWEIHPYAQWVTIMDSATPAGCAALHGKAWRINGEAFESVVAEHYLVKKRACKCRIRPLSMWAQLEEKVTIAG